MSWRHSRWRRGGLLVAWKPEVHRAFLSMLEVPGWGFALFGIDGSMAGSKVVWACARGRRRWLCSCRRRWVVAAILALLGLTYGSCLDRPNLA